MIILIVLGVLNVGGLSAGAGAAMMIVTLLAEHEPAGFFAFSMLAIGPAQLVLTVPTAILAVVGIARKRQALWYLAIVAISLLALFIDIAGFVLAVWF